MISPEKKREEEQEAEPISWASFLEESSAGTVHPVRDVIEIDGPFFNIATPDIHMYCDHEACRVQRRFRYNGLKLAVSIGKTADYELRYLCSNCESSQNTLRVHLHISSLFGSSEAMKY
jgi:hypothetical protein